VGDGDVLDAEPTLRPQRERAVRTEWETGCVKSRSGLSGEGKTLFSCRELS